MAFTGQLAVITGGGSGMGQAWARQLANEEQPLPSSM